MMNYGQDRQCAISARTALTYEAIKNKMDNVMVKFVIEARPNDISSSIQLTTVTRKRLIS